MVARRILLPRQQLSEQLRNEQEVWIRKESEVECHVLKKACETLKQSGFDMSHVDLKFGHEDDIARNILEEARSGHHETIVVGRHGTSQDQTDLWRRRDR